jgi:anaerobic magnesium-protoporphyrin IX monomethyl ester cyclase
MGFDVRTKRSATILWSRGCPYQCSFCWRMMGPGMRFRSIDSLIDEIRYLRSTFGVDSYQFADECINANRNKTMRLMEKLIDNGLDAPWYAPARANLFDEEMARLFKRSGCVGLNFGVESASPEMLAVMNKRATPEQASEGVRLAKQFGIAPICTFILGMPGETRATVQESVNWIKRNRVERVSFFFATPFPGCDLYEQPFVKGRIMERYGTKDGYFSVLREVTDLTVNLTEFSDRELLELQRNARLRTSLFAGYQWIRFLRNPKRWGSLLRKLIAVFRAPS